MCKPPVIQLATNAAVQSQVNGQPQVYWTPAPTYGVCSGAQLLQIGLNINQISGSGAAGTVIPKFRAVGQWSLDGENWKWFLKDLTGAKTGTSNVDPYVDRYIGAPFGAEFAAPFVRFGIWVEADGSGAAGLVQGRVTAFVQPLFD